MLSRQSILWLIWGCVVICAILLFLHEASGATRKSAAVHQGAGSAALLKGIKKAALSAPPIPPDLVVAATNKARYFAVTATGTNGQTSGYSLEVSTTNPPPITLAWDCDSSDQGVTNYTVWRGTSPGVYTRSFNAGTNCQLSVPPPPPSNLVVTIVGPSLSLSLTNPIGMLLITGKSLAISSRYQ